MSKTSTTSQIVFASTVSVVGNTLLAVIKIAAGLIGGSIAVLSDGIDSATDVVISFVMLVTAKIMNRPPDEHYAYGYSKAEGIATKTLSFIIFYAGIQMLLSAISGIVHPTKSSMPDRITVYVTVISIVAKLLLSLYQTAEGKRLKSSMLLANGVNMRNDIITSLSVLVGLFFTFVLELPILDSITALLVSVIIIKSAIKIFKDSSVLLMDGMKDGDIYKKIFAAVALVPEAHNPHKVRSRSIGNMYAIVLDVEVDDRLTVREAHNIANAVEQSIKESIPEIFDIVVHIEPLGDNRSHEAYGIDSENDAPSHQ